jgi:hypothetical protein
VPPNREASRNVPRGKGWGIGQSESEWSVESDDVESEKGSGPRGPRGLEG